MPGVLSLTCLAAMQLIAYATPGTRTIYWATLLPNAVQASSDDTLQPTPLEAFARQAGTHIAWSRQVGRVDSTEAHAVVTALVVEDSAQPPDRIRGIRIDLTNGDARDAVYLGEETLSVYKNALDQISRDVARERSRKTGGGATAQAGTECLGACVFWYGDKAPQVHCLNAAYCIAPDWSGLTLSAFRQVGFRFPGRGPSQLSTAIARARTALQKH
jgi:hypothetical protein